MAIRPPLWEFVFLSMLLHALAIALFGAPSGGSREGRAMWGSLQVVLQGAPESAPGLRIERRLEGVPAALARPSREASRARPERARPTPAPVAKPAAPAPAAKIEAPRVEAPKVDAPSVVPDAAPRETPFVVPPLLDRVKPAEPDVEMVPLPDVPIPPQTPIATPAEEPAPRLAAPPPTPEPATVAEPVIEPPAVVPPVTVQPPAVERAPIDAPKIEAPIVQPAESPLPPPTPPASSAPVEAPALPVPNATPPVAQPPVELPALPVPETRSATPPVPETRSATPPVPVAPKLPVEAAPELPSSVPLPPPATAIETPPRRESAMPPKSAASPGRSPDLAPAPKREGSESLFKRGAPPGDYDPTRPAAPSLDLDALKKRAGELGREGSGQRALLAFPMPPVPPRKSKMETAIENARKPDCRTAYQALGLAAAIPLIANEFGEGNCRW